MPKVINLGQQKLGFYKCIVLWFVVFSDRLLCAIKWTGNCVFREFTTKVFVKVVNLFKLRDLKI